MRTIGCKLRPLCLRKDKERYKRERRSGNVYDKGDGPDIICTYERLGCSRTL